MKISILTEIRDFGVKSSPYWRKAKFLFGGIRAGVKRANKVVINNCAFLCTLNFARVFLFVSSNILLFSHFSHSQYFSLIIILLSFYSQCCSTWRLTVKKHPQMKLQRFRKVWIWTFRCLVHQVNSLYGVLKLNQNFRKNKVVPGKTLFFVISPFCIRHSICLNIGF